MHPRLFHALAAAALAAALAGCSRKHAAPQPPPRATDPVPAPGRISTLAVPVEIDSAVLLRAVEDAVPHQLWTIDQHFDRCLKPARVKLFGARIKVTPDIGCTVTGTVTRGPIRLRGEGRDIVADVPIQAEIGAHDIGGVVSGETATGSALAHARIRLDLDGNWNPRGTVQLSYGWTEPPGVDFLGQRITFTGKADERLQPVIRKLEASLPRELAKLHLRDRIDQLWRRGFTTLALNDDKPPVWMRLTPQKLHYGGYQLQGGQLRLNLGLDATTETFVGPRPADPVPKPLPALARGVPAGGLDFYVPVVADYAQLEPVILRALVKRSARPFQLPGIGAVGARFERVTAYGTTGHRIAVGVHFAAVPVGANLGETRGTIWLVARPVNAPGSARVHFEQLSVTGDTDGIGGDLLVRLASTGSFSDEIAASLTQNFSRDLDDLLGRIRHAIEVKQTGDFVIHARVDRVRIGRILAYGQGLRLPVAAQGSASVRYRPTG